MLRPLRGIDQTQAEYDELARAAEGRQWPVAVLADVYRWGARVGVVPALAGLVLGVATRAGRRRHLRAVALGSVLLVGVAARIAALTVVEATAFDTRYGVYVLPGAGFLVGFLVTGWWVLGGLVADRWGTRRASTGQAGGAEEVEPERDGDDRLDAASPGDARPVPQ
jgi:hypothetical protein